MASLQDRLTALATRVGVQVKAMAPRLLVSGGSVGQVLTKSSAVDYASTWQSLRQLVGFYCYGKPLAGEPVGAYVAEVAFTLPASLAGSIARALIAATASATWTLTRIPAGSTTETAIATLTFAAGNTLASFSAQAAVSVGVGDILRLKAPASQDGTLADITFTFVGVR